MEKNRPILINQNEELTNSDFRDLRKFLKHCSSEELRKWLTSVIVQCKDYTKSELEKLRVELTVRLDSETRLKDRYFKEKDILQKYCDMPWLQRVFTKPPVIHRD